MAAWLMLAAPDEAKRTGPVINEGTADGPSVPDGNSLRRVHDRRTGRTAGKLRCRRTSVALQVAAHKQTLAIAELIVELRNVRIESGRVWSRPSEAARIQPVSSRTIGSRVSAKGGQCVWVVTVTPRTSSRANRVHSGDLRRGQRLNPTGWASHASRAVIANISSHE